MALPKMVITVCVTDQQLAAATHRVSAGAPWTVTGDMEWLFTALAGAPPNMPNNRECLYIPDALSMNPHLAHAAQFIRGWVDGRPFKVEVEVAYDYRVREWLVAIAFIATGPRPENAPRAEVVIPNASPLPTTRRLRIKPKTKHPAV